MLIPASTFLVLDIEHVAACLGSVPDIIEASFMICLSRDLIKADLYSREKWATDGDLRRLGHDLEGKVCGIIGLGRIGFEVAKRVHASGMRILYYDVFQNSLAHLYG